MSWLDRLEHPTIMLNASDRTQHERIQRLRRQYVQATTHTASLTRQLQRTLAHCHRLESLARHAVAAGSDDQARRWLQVLHDTRHTLAELATEHTRAEAQATALRSQLDAATRSLGLFHAQRAAIEAAWLHTRQLF